MHGIPLESGVNNCYFNMLGKCINKKVTRSETTKVYDLYSKQNCTVTIYGVHACGGYKPDRGLMKLPEKITVEGGDILTLEECKDDDEYLINWASEDRRKTLWIRDLRSESRDELFIHALKLITSYGYVKEGKCNETIKGEEDARRY